MTAIDRDDNRRAFSARLNQLLDFYGVPRKNAGRQVLMRTQFGVSQESARKWLEGEAIPRDEKLIQICKEYPCRKEWLQNGVGQMINDPETEQLLDIWAKIPTESRKAVLTLIRGAGTLAESKD